MIITAEKWNDVIAATRAGIDMWKERAAERQLKDTFAVTVQTSDKYLVLLTTHHDGYSSDHHLVVREVATGEVHAAKPIIKRSEGFGLRLVGYTVKTPDPKAWKSLADKPADQIVKKLGLTDFLVVLGVSSSVSSG